MTRSPALLALCLLPAAAAAQGSRPAARPAAPPELSALRAAAAKTRARLKSEAATWRVVLETEAGQRIAVDVLKTPVAERRIVYLQSKGGPPREALRLVIQPDAWYAAEAGGARGIYRPRQVPFAFSRAYAVLRAADLRYVSGKRAPGNFVRLRDGRAAYRAPLPRARRARLQERIRKLERIGRVAPAKAKELAPRLRAAREALVNGRIRLVDVATGILFGHGLPGARVRLVHFSWRKSYGLTAFAIEDGKGALPDRRELPKQLALLAHCGHWRKGSPADELDARVLDLETGALRRVPYRGSIALPGCVLPGGKAVIVCGQDAGGVGLYRVDLLTGAGRRLGGGPLERGVCFSPAVSPDGKYLAVLHMPEPRQPRAQAYVLELAKGGSATPLGKTIPATALDWFPDGGALLLDRRVRFLPGKPATSSIVRLDRGRGTLRVLREGEDPRIALGGKAILFRTGDTWKLCDLDGGKPRVLGEGLSGLRQPAVSPDGRRVLMLQSSPAGPRPVLVDLSSGALKPVPLEQKTGLWGFPGW